MNRRAPPIPPGLALIVAVLAVSTGAIFARLADAPALVIAAYRCLGATAILLPLAWFRARHELEGMTRREWALGLGAGCFLAIHFASWISSLDYTTVASSVVLVSTSPVWVGLLTPLISRDRLSRMTVLGIVVSVVGAVIIGIEDFQIGGPALFGDALAVIGAMTVGVYLLIGRRLRQKLSLLSYVVVCYGMAGALLLALILLLGLPLGGYSPDTYLWLLAVAVVPQVIGHSSYNWALGWFSASMIAVTLVGEPVLSTILAYLVLDETIGMATLQGGLILLLGIYLAARGEGGQRAPQTSLNSEAAA
jgi:drug/metabolite transporter (DMT)-like permease